MTFILKNKLEKHIFFIKLQQFFNDLGIRFVPLFEWEFRSERHDLGTEKEGIYFKKLEYEKKKKKQLAYKWRSPWKLSFKSTFFSIIWPLFSRWCVLLNHC